MATKKSDGGGFAPLPGHEVLEDEVAVGFVSGIFGTSGDVRVHLYNRESTHFRKRRLVALVDSKGKRYAANLKCRSGAGARVLGNLEILRTREDAAALRDWRIAVPKASLPQLEPTEFYLADVIGRDVAIGDEVMGTVLQVHQTGPVDILEMSLTDGEVGYVPALAVNIADIRADPVQLHPAARELLG
ncbi:MAG: 16S rRNA processing protein RimM [Myxococcota bacterium]|jgi:16S rRNA processing protein RimM